MSGKNSVPCFKCGKELDFAGMGEPDHAKPSGNQPSGGTAFATCGHWGSTYFDSIDGMEKIEIAICDPCLRANEGAIAGPFRYGELPSRERLA